MGTSLSELPDWGKRSRKHLDFIIFAGCLDDVLVMIDSMVADCTIPRPTTFRESARRARVDVGTHFCYNPMLLEAFAYLLRRILDVADARAKEDAATAPPATTTGGGRPGAPPAGGASSTATPAGNATAAARAANATLAPTAKAATHRPTRFPPKRRKRHKGRVGD